MEKYWELRKTFLNSANQEVVGEFLLSLKLANGSEKTVRTYRWYLEKFFEKREESFLTLSSDTIYQWFQKYDGVKSEATIKLRLCILSSFYKFCVQEELLEKSPIKTRWHPRLPQPIPHYLEKSELAKTRQQTELSSLRNQVLIEFMVTSGCRVSEIVGLNQSDVNLENRTARVIGKGKKIREVHFTEKCALLMERYLTDEVKKCEALFVTTNGKRLGVRAIQHLVRAIGEEAQLGKRLFPHRLRHTFATELLSKGAELSFIADELGHTDVRTTQIYARLPKQELITLYRKYMG